MLGGLLQGGLGERAVGVGFLEGWIEVGARLRCAGSGSRGGKPAHATELFEVCTLLLSKAGARFLDPCGKGDLYILGHGLLGPADGTRLLRLAHHLLDLLDTSMTVMEALCDLLGELLDLGLLGALGVVVIEARKDMLLVQLLEALALGSDVGEQVSDLVGNVGPAWGKQVHLNYGVAIVVECAGRQQAAAIFVRIVAAGVGIGQGTGPRRAGSVGSPLRGMVRIRLPVGDV